MITILNHQEHPVDTAWMQALMEQMLTTSGYHTFDVGILLADDTAMARYNSEYRHKQGPTDILSFAYYPEHEAGTELVVEDEEERNLGDLILAPAYIAQSAQELGVTYEHRMMVLLVHGLCHLLGYDHEKDADYALMKAQEDALMASLPQDLVR